MIAYLLHYIACALAVSLSAIGVGIGQGIVGGYASRSLSRQSMGSDQSFTAMIIGLAITETGVIFGLVISFILLLSSPIDGISLGGGIAQIGMALAIGLPAASVGIAIGFALKATCGAIMRQPLSSRNSMTLMLVMLSFIEAPVIFSFIIALLINMGIQADMSLYEGIRLGAAGFIFAFGSIGSVIGQAIYAHKATHALGLNPASYERLFTFTLLCIAVIETPVIFCLVLSFLFIYVPISFSLPTMTALTLIASALALGFGAIGAGIGNGYAAGKGAHEIALDTNNYGQVLKATMVTIAIIESSAIYAFIIALLLFTKAL